MKADTAQADRSRHHRAFQDANAARELLADGAQASARHAAPPGRCRKRTSRLIWSRLGKFEALTPRSTGIARRASPAARLRCRTFRPSLCQRCIYGAIRTRPSAAIAAEATANSSPDLIASKYCPASAISSPTRRRTARLLLNDLATRTGLKGLMHKAIIATWKKRRFLN